MRSSPQCPVEGCTRKRAYRGFKHGKPNWRGTCEKHGSPYRQLRARVRPDNQIRHRTMPNHVCAACGFQGLCHRHRLIPELGYKPSNVIILCPSCHYSISVDGKRDHQRPVSLEIAQRAVKGTATEKQLTLTLLCPKR